MHKNENSSMYSTAQAETERKKFSTNAHEILVVVVVVMQ